MPARFYRVTETGEHLFVSGSSPKVVLFEEKMVRIIIGVVFCNSLY